MSGNKVKKVMKEYKQGELHSGSKHGKKVTNPKQAVAIALNEERQAEEHDHEAHKHLHKSQKALKKANK